MHTYRWTVLLLPLLLATLGCERPPVPEPTQESGPPKPVVVDLKSDQGKELLAASKRHHDNFVPVKTELPPATVEPAPPAAAPLGGPTAPSPTAPTPPANQPATAPANTPPATTPAAAPSTPAAPAATPAAPAPGMPPAGPDAAANGGQVSAASVAGRKGKEFGSGFIATPIGAYFGAKEKIAVMQMEEQLKLWSTQHERAPRNTEEFMDVVVKAASIRLPELRPGERYYFDPKQGPHGTLMIQQPAPQPM